MTIDVKSDLSDFSRLNVLIIDDNLLVHSVLKSALIELGIREVRCSETAYFGLKLCEETRFHIIICSFNVKSDKDGFHLLEELKFKGHVTKTTILIFLSTETSESLVNSIVELQPDDFWVKPLSFKTVQTRLIHIIDVKKTLFNIYHAIDKRNFSKAIYYADRHLLNKDLKTYHGNITRMKGDALLGLLEYKEAESFYRELMTQYKYAWVHIGYVKSLLKQGRLDEIDELLVTLINKPETRFATHDLLAQYYIEEEEYELAYEEIKRATELAPRNIDRNKKSWDLARLNHDHQGQYEATCIIAKNAKNSIHDSPILLLNVIRAGIDLACTITDSGSDKVLDQTERYIKQLERDYDDAHLFKQQLVVAKARLHNANNQEHLAKRLVESQVSLKPTNFIEDNLDKVKVFHELGMREEAIFLLDAIKKQIAGDSLSSQVVNKYVEQETEERSDIHFTPKQLNSMAVEHFQKKRMHPALDSLSQALKLTPKNVKLTLSLIKVLIVIKQEGELEENDLELANNAFTMLETAKLVGKYAEVFKDLKVKWKDADGIAV